MKDRTKIHFHPHTPLIAIAKYCAENHATVRIYAIQGADGSVMPGMEVEAPADKHFVPTFLRPETANG